MPLKDAADALLAYYGNSMREQAAKSQGDLWGDFFRRAPIALAGMRAGPAAGSMRPFNPKAPEAPLPRRPDSSIDSDNGWPQHIYEALLGRQRNSATPDVPADPGSGWWHVGKQPIPKPTNILPWLTSGALGYGIWKWGGGPEMTKELTGPSGPKIGELLHDIFTGQIAQKYRDWKVAKDVPASFP